MIGYVSFTEKIDTYHRIWKGSYALLLFNHISIMPVHLGIQTWTEKLKANSKQYKTDVLGFAFN